MSRLDGQTLILVHSSVFIDRPRIALRLLHEQLFDSVDVKYQQSK